MLLVDGELVAVDEFEALERFKEHTIDVLIGTIEKGSKKGILDLAKQALEIGKGTAKARPAPSVPQAEKSSKGKNAKATKTAKAAKPKVSKKIAKASSEEFRILSSEMNCPDCGRSFEELDPRLFSFNSPHGWCEHCRGFGEVWSEIPKAQDFDSQLEADLAAEKSFENREEGETRPCPVCGGDRLNPVACAVRIQGESIASFSARSANDALTLSKDWNFK